MILLEYIQSLPPETWGFLGAGGAGVITAILKFFSYYKAQQRKQLERVASVIAETIQGSLSDALERAGKCEYEQRQKVKRLLMGYSATVCRTARQAVEGMLCGEPCENIDLVAGLYSDCIQNTFITDVFEYFDAEVIGQKWLIDDTEKRIEEDITEIRKNSFAVFLSSMRRRFRHEKIQVRVDWIEKNMDIVYMRSLISDIVHGCRDIEIEHKERANVHHAKLLQKIVADLSA
jgi:hypothetical protein